MALRQLRVAHQFGGNLTSDRPRFRLEEREPPSTGPDFLTLQRMQISLGQIATTSMHLRPAADELRKLDLAAHGVIYRWGGASGPTLLAGEIDDSKQLTVTIHEANDRRRQINVAGQSAVFAEQRFGDLAPILPWTFLNSPYQPSCCEHRDFEFCVAVIASRGKKQPTRERIRTAQTLR
jgi:hypothetical protein